ncbi:MAG: ribonuclease R [Methylobacteriaceae bacterium]|nr:ribonuclease R [Methylobacteriaceae bacterium]
MAKTAGPKATRSRAARKSGDAPALSRESVLDFITREGGPGGAANIGKRDIARAFGLDGAGRIALKKILKELERDGAIGRRRKTLHKPGELPAVVLADITGRDEDGELIATPVEWDEEHGAPPRIRVKTPRRPRPGEPTPGVGQRALLRVEPESEPDEAPYAGRVIRILERARARLLGVYRRTAFGEGRILPIDKKNAQRELVVPEGAERNAVDGDLVAYDARREGRFGPLAGIVTEVVGALKSEKAVSLIAIRSHGLPDEFRRKTLQEAEAARPAPLKDREDWRNLPLVTIDPADAKDHDDAVHARPDDDPQNPGGHVVTVAIADVAWYVRPGASLDRDALERGNSVYFPDRVVPMLPERISNDLCSLRGGEDRPALAVRMTLAADGRKLRHSFHRVMMRSAAKLAYPQAQAAIDGRPDETTAPLLESVLKPLWAAYACAAAARERRQPLDLDLPERKLVLKADGSVDRVVTPERLAAHRLIEEFMILANVAAAETLEASRQALIYRVHDEPSAEKLTALAEFLASIDIRLPKGQTMRPSNFNAVLARVKGGEHEAIVNEVVLRSQAQAEYAAENYGHFGLHLKRYAHFTSPIRRYADLIVHRALIRALGLGEGGLPETSLEELAEIAARISAAERRAMAAERETVDRLIAGFLADRIGAQFPGRIAGVTRAGLFVKLRDTGADGFVPAATLGRDYYAYDEAAHALIGSATGETFRLGDEVEVKLVEAAPVAGALRFEMVSEGRAGPSRAARMRRKQKPDKSPGKRAGKARPGKSGAGRRRGGR